MPLDSDNATLQVICKDCGVAFGNDHLNGPSLILLVNVLKLTHLQPFPAAWFRRA